MQVHIRKCSSTFLLLLLLLSLLRLLLYNVQLQGVQRSYNIFVGVTVGGRTVEAYIPVRKKRGEG